MWFIPLLLACSPLPDLPIDVELSESSLQIGPSAAATFEVRNVGHTHATVWIARLEGPSAGSLSVQDLAVSDVIEAGDTQLVTITQNAPATEDAAITLDFVSYAGLGGHLRFSLPIEVSEGAALCDADGDGADGPACGGPDCNDDDPAQYPGADEVCDGLDNNCDGQADEGLEEQASFYDDDGDGFGGAQLEGCQPGPNTVPTGGDCDDSDNDTYPGAPERCDDVDHDCDGETHNDVVDGITVFTDADGDGFGDSPTARTVCERPPDAALEGGDCDDRDATTYPGAVDSCDGVDNDCDGIADEDSTFVEHYADLDGDGYGQQSTAVASCAVPPGRTTEREDCDDGNAAVSPAAEETCNGLDDDCDGEIDEDGDGPLVSYADLDGDGFGDPLAEDRGCTVPPGNVTNDEDCDDGDASVAPGQPERCNLADDNCDGLVDNDPIDPTTFFLDADADGFGDPAVSTTTCSRPSGHTTTADDCDDDDSQRFPDAPERCNGIDDSCDGLVDNDPVDAPTWYADADSDGFGDPDSASIQCAQPAQSVPDNGDCNDNDPGTFPGATERCDGEDQDCNDLIDDEAVDATDWFGDGDGDGSVGDGLIVRACEQPPGTGALPEDCRDDDPAIFPGASERCDGIDNNCDGAVDEPDKGQPDWYADSDVDGFGAGPIIATQCSTPRGAADNDDDCDDRNSTINPDAEEVCNGLDDDCDSTPDDDAVDAKQWHPDLDRDGFGDRDIVETRCVPGIIEVEDGTDCDDGDRSIFPGAPEVCDGVDQDCDDVIDNDPIDPLTFFADVDLDGFGDPNNAVQACDAPAETVDNGEDCNDADSRINPDAEEYCDPVDRDCSGLPNDSGIDSDGDGIDNCLDDTIWDEPVPTPPSGGEVPATDLLDWTVVEFEAMACCGASPLPAPTPLEEIEPEDPFWTITPAGHLRIAGNSPHTAIVGPYHGRMETWQLTVMMVAAGVNNDSAGIVFNFRNTASMWMFRWDNPDGSYPRFGKQGRIELIECNFGECVIVNSLVVPAVPEGSVNELVLNFDSNVITAELVGVGTISNPAPPRLGPGNIGVYGFDIDFGGEFWDFSLTQP